MSTTNTSQAKLALDLPMDEIRNAAILNLAAGSAKTVPATGAPRVIYDYYMGSSIAFYGKESFQLNEFKISAAQGGSLECWLNMDPCQGTATTQQLIYLKNNATKEAWGINTPCPDGSLLLQRFEPSPNSSTLAAKIDHDKWVHFALNIGSDGAVKTYLNGVLAGDIVSKEFAQFINGDKTFQLQIGARETKDFFSGKICQLKFFTGVRAAEEIKLSMEEGRSANATFKSSYPIEFRLNSLDNGSEHPVLYIENNTNGHPLRLDMINTSGTAVKFYGGPVKDFTLSEDQYHIQLRFKKQVVAAEVLEKLAKVTEGWTCIAGKNPTLLEDWISFKRTTVSTEEEFTGLQSITLNNMRAEAMAGSRNTLVEIKYNNLYYKDSQYVLNGSLSRHLDIISHLGKRNVPFDVSIKGASTILNDGGSANSFQIIIRNIAGEPVRFAPKKGGATQYSIFSLSCKEPVTFNDKPTFSFAGNKFKEDASTANNNLPKTFICEDNQVLNQGDESFVIDVSTLKTSHASGTLILYLEYRNIPGYWDGVIPIPLQLGRIVERNNRIGINTIAPEADLHVKGTLKADNLDIKSPLKADNLEVKNAKADNLQVKGNIKSEARVMDKTGDLMPVGAIIAYGGNTAPAGWLLCDGKTVINGKPEYQDLFNVLKTNTTPNLRKQFIVGADPETPDYKLHAQGGAASVVLKEDQLPKHRHSGMTSNENVIKASDYKLMGKRSYKRNFASGIAEEGIVTKVKLDYACGYDSYCDDPANIDAAINSQHAHSFITGETGKDQAHENRPPYYALTYIIKY